MEAHAPANMAEQLLVEKMAISLCKQQRLIRVETADINANMQRNTAVAQKQLTTNSIQAYAFPVNADRLFRYHALLENHYYEALNALVQMQEKRKNQIIGELVTDVSDPAKGNED